MKDKKKEKNTSRRSSEHGRKGDCDSHTVAWSRAAAGPGPPARGARTSGGSRPRRRGGPRSTPARAAAAAGERPRPASNLPKSPTKSTLSNCEKTSAQAKSSCTSRHLNIWAGFQHSRGYCGEKNTQTTSFLSSEVAGWGIFSSRFFILAMHAGDRKTWPGKR